MWNRLEGGGGWVKKCMLGFVGDLKVVDHLKYTVVDRLIILKRILEKCEVRVWPVLIWLRIGASEGLL
jgi:hypothetical protein